MLGVSTRGAFFFVVVVRRSHVSLTLFELCRPGVCVALELPQQAGRLVYLGYNFDRRQPGWDQLLRAAVAKHL